MAIRNELVPKKNMFLLDIQESEMQELDLKLFPRLLVKRIEKNKTISSEA